MHQRVVVTISAVALVAVVAGGATLAARSSGSSHTPKTITIQGADVGASATTMAASAPAGFVGPHPNGTFVLSGDLPLLNGDLPAWHFAANPTADFNVVAALAKTLGLEGDVAAVEGGWSVGDQNSGHSLFVSKAPGLPWNYSNFVAPASYTCDGRETPSNEPPRTTVPSPDCVPPPPPAGVPTKDEALARAGDLLKALGIDAGSLTITANANEWSAEVLAIPNLDGITAQGLMSTFSFGGEGKLQSANGYLLAPEKADNYPRIGTAKAFESLKSGDGTIGSWSAYGGGGGVVTTVPMTSEVATSSPTTVVSVPGSTVFCTSVATAVDQPMSPSGITCGSIVCGYVPVTTIPASAPADATTAPPPPPCPVPSPPEPVTITITGVHETLLQLMGADGSMWLVPGYEFTSADGGTWPVLAIDQSFVDQVAPAQPVPETAVAMGSSSAPPTTAAGG